MCVRGLDGANTNTRMVQASRDFCSSNWNNSNRAAAVPLSLALNHLQPPGFASLLSGFSHPSGEMDFFFFFLKRRDSLPGAFLFLLSFVSLLLSLLLTPDSHRQLSFISSRSLHLLHCLDYFLPIHLERKKLSLTQPVASNPRAPTGGPSTPPTPLTPSPHLLLLLHYHHRHHPPSQSASL